MPGAILVTGKTEEAREKFVRALAEDNEANLRVVLPANESISHEPTKDWLYFPNFAQVPIESQAILVEHAREHTAGMVILGCASTNEIQELVAEGKVREDLYYRASYNLLDADEALSSGQY